MVLAGTIAYENMGLKPLVCFGRQIFGSEMIFTGLKQNGFSVK
jgi:hypothetical protein